MLKTFHRKKRSIKENKRNSTKFDSSIVAGLIKSKKLFSPSVENHFADFVRLLVSTLDFYDENLHNIYSHAFVWAYFSIKQAPELKINKKVYKNAYEECRKYINNISTEEIRNEEDLVINLYSFTMQ
ncbi:hypothetical protein NUSPORA_01916 [Nucleospora cyclopteri]